MAETQGQRIKKIRYAEEMTQQQFADFLGTTKARVCLWENDKSGISMTYRRKINRSIGYNLNEDIDMQIQKKIYRKELGI